MKIAVLGATGLVGKHLLQILGEREFPCSDMVLVASHRSRGDTVRVAERDYRVIDIEEHWYEGVDLAFSVVEAGIARQLIPEIRGEIPLIIDNSSAFRMEPDVPLVVPQVNPSAALEHRGIIANPNCSTIQLVTAVNPIHGLSPIRRMIVATYQASSGAGKEFMEKFLLDSMSDARDGFDPLSDRPGSLSFNVLPTISDVLEDGFCTEEEKLMLETPKIMNDERIQVSATTVRVPVVNTHSEAVYLETEEKLDLSSVEKVLMSAPGVRYVGDSQNPPTPRDVSGSDDVFVGRLRRDRFCDRGIHLWIVADNLRKGAGLNAVEIAELFLTDVDRPATPL
jgi:aspartate-semialdehyde dehydrogenase